MEPPSINYHAAVTGRLLYFINPDHLNSARSIGYANGQNVWTRSPTPFGEDAPNQNPNGYGAFTYNQGPFPGQYRDTETGLAYNMLRDYAPKIGRYVQSDPIGLAGGSFSTYGYVGGNPLGRVDPWGLAFVARRPLSGLPWFGSLSMSSAFGTNAALSHAQIFFEDKMSPANLGFFEDSTIHYGENAQEYHLSSGHYNDCVMRSAVAKLNYSTKYSIASNNCQDWVGNVLQQYDKLMRDPVTIAQCFFQ